MSTQPGTASVPAGGPELAAQILQRLQILEAENQALRVQTARTLQDLASLQAQKVLCGHCGTWSVMGKLLSPEAAGVCQTCKEKVLSKV